MIDLGISKLALVGAVALIVIGPEKLPRVARTVGAFIARSQRYLNDVKAEIGRSVALDELKKMHRSVQTAAQDVQRSMQTGIADFDLAGASTPDTTGSSTADAPQPDALDGAMLAYRPRPKHWRTRRSAVPHWYKARTGIRTRVQSAAARAARLGSAPHQRSGSLLATDDYAAPSA